MFRIVLTGFDGEVHVSGFEFEVDNSEVIMMHRSCNLHSHHTNTSVIVIAVEMWALLILWGNGINLLQISVKNARPKVMTGNAVTT